MTTPDSPAEPESNKATAAIKALLPAVVEQSPSEAVKILDPYPAEFAVQMLELLNPSVAQDVLERFSTERRQKVMAAASPELRRQWTRNEAYDENTVGHMMEPP